MSRGRRPKTSEFSPDSRVPEEAPRALLKSVRVLRGGVALLELAVIEGLPGAHLLPDLPRLD